MSIQHFDVPFGRHTLKADLLPGVAEPDVLMIHGAGQSHRGGLSGWRNALAAHDLGTLAFDCIGHGATGGALAESSVASRTHQAAAVLQAANCDARLAVIGASMGAYNAVKLAQCRPVEALVLMVPGVYTPQAYEVPFGPGFSSIIRRERSWAGSDAWDILARYEGRLLIVAAEHDAVIPMEIPQRLFDVAVRSCWRRLYVVRDAGHRRMFELLQERPAELTALTNLMAACLRGIGGD
jgi:pimeloyl-ACP methyl ester carboxylesterase